MRIGIIQFPGSNCERETILAVKRAGMEPVEFLWNQSRELLHSFDGYVIVGGFSYEDRSRAGIIAALDPVMLAIKAEAEKGKPVLGICNGAQILVETGLVPGLENNKIGMALTENKRMLHDKVLGTGFYNAWVHMRLSANYQRNAFTRHLTEDSFLSVPVAHGEGRFVMTEALWQEVAAQGLAVFQYCDEHGKIVDAFPVNPNGSLHNIAAVSNKAGNVMAMMPHPERTPNGDPIFQSMRDYIADNRHEKTLPLYYYPRRAATPTYQKSPLHHECIVSLTITDNHALTVQNSLRHLGLAVTVQRRIHWEIQCDATDTLQLLKQSGVLFNDRKEYEMTQPFSINATSPAFLVRAHDDIIGQQKLQACHDYANLPGVQSIRHGVLWQFIMEEARATEMMQSILQTNIIANPYAHDCYQYQSITG